MEAWDRLGPSELLEAARETLGRRLPPEWSVEKAAMAGDSAERDLVIKSPHMAAQAPLLVEARMNFAPRDVQALLGGLVPRLRRQAGETPILLVAPYLSPRTRDLLTAQDINYLDLTGNIRVAIRYPPLFIDVQGAQGDPRKTSGGRGIRGAKAGAVVRVLADFLPPYSGAQIAQAARVNEGYVSRILESLEDDGLIERPPRGPVIDVDWAGLLRRRAQALNLFRSTGTFRFVAREGPRRVLEGLRRIENQQSLVVTGSFAAERIAPIVAPATLVLYSKNPRLLSERLDLMPVESGADVVMIRPDNNVVFDRAKREGGLRWAAASQVVIDCLSGSGRMPSDGEALLGWMRVNEDEWRNRRIRKNVPQDTST
jgi:hypothetical protein